MGPPTGGKGLGKKGGKPIGKGASYRSIADYYPSTQYMSYPRVDGDFFRGLENALQTGKWDTQSGQNNSSGVGGVGGRRKAPVLAPPGRRTIAGNAGTAPQPSIGPAGPPSIGNGSAFGLVSSGFENSDAS